MNFLRIVTALCVAVSACMASAQLAGTPIAVDKDGKPYYKGRVLVGFREGAATPAVQKGTAMFGGVVDVYMPEIKVAVVLYPEDTDIFAKIAQISKSPQVRFAEPDGVVYAEFTPNDTYWSQQWGPKKINCETAWDLHKGDAGTVIAIVDTGINYNHPDLSSKYVGGYDYYNNDSNPMDDNGHGTHCAGIAAAATNNGVGIAGVAFNCKLMAVKVLGAGGSGSDSTVAQGINYATSNGAKVISLSLGSSSGSSTMQSAVNNAWNNGVVVAAAAGNSGTTQQFYPAAYTNCIAVAASTTSDTRASFSNYGASWVDVAAPGVSIYSTYGSSYTNLDGTSMACPHVAGAAGLVYSKYSATRSNANAVVVRNAIESTCVNVGNWVAYGRINVAAALQSLQGPPSEFTYQAESITVQLGMFTYGNVASLHALDGNRLGTESDVLFTYIIPGFPIRETYGTDYYAQFDVGTGSKVSGVIDLTAFATNPGIQRVQLYNWSAARWEYALISSNIGLTENTWAIDFPSGVSSYISSSNKVRVRLLTSSALPHNYAVDRLQLRMMGY